MLYIFISFSMRFLHCYCDYFDVIFFVSDALIINIFRSIDVNIMLTNQINEFIFCAEIIVSLVHFHIIYRNFVSSNSAKFIAILRISRL